MSLQIRESVRCISIWEQAKEVEAGASIVKIMAGKGSGHVNREFKQTDVRAIIEGRSGHEHGKVKYQGALYLTNDEIFELFLAAVKASNTPESLKKVARTMVAELKKISVAKAPQRLEDGDDGR